MSEPPGHGGAPGWGPPWPGRPGVILRQRPVSPQEQRVRVGLAERGGYHPRTLWYMLAGIVFLFFAPWAAAAGNGEPGAVWWGVGAASLATLLFLGAFLFGRPPARRALLATFESELGPGRVLSLAWNGWGLGIGGGASQRAIAYDDVWYASVRPGPAGGAAGGYLCLRYRGVGEGASPPILALPMDLVPEPALRELTGRGVIAD